MKKMMNQDTNVPPVSFGTCVMVYTMALTKALLPDKDLKESVTLEQSDTITRFIDKVIDEAFDPMVAPLIKQAFVAELQMFQQWTQERVKNQSS
jgi:hypothetical protein